MEMEVFNAVALRTTSPCHVIICIHPSLSGTLVSQSEGQTKAEELEKGLTEMEGTMTNVWSCEHTGSSKNLTVKSTMFRHRNIHKFTWTSPDGKAHEQIDHSDMDHSLMGARVGERLAVNK
jgi:hypothetical protein